MRSSAVNAIDVRLSNGTLRTGVLAGLAGGAIEIGWIALYQYLAGEASAPVASGVTQSLLPGLAGGEAGVVLGVVLHMALAIGLGIVVAVVVDRLMPRIADTLLEPAAVVLMLGAVWAINFFVILPALNPDFVSLVPYGASLASKLLFGVAAALVFRVTRRRHVAAERGW